MTGSPVVALIHATPAAMARARAAFDERFPPAELWNLLDDRLISEAEAAGGLTPALRHRMSAPIRHAVGGGADAVLLSCITGTVVEGTHQAARDPAGLERLVVDAARRVRRRRTHGASRTVAELRHLAASCGVAADPFTTEAA